MRRPMVLSLPASGVDTEGDLEGVNSPGTELRNGMATYGAVILSLLAVNKPLEKFEAD